MSEFVLDNQVWFYGLAVAAFVAAVILPYTALARRAFSVLAVGLALFALPAWAALVR